MSLYTNYFHTSEANEYLSDEQLVTYMLLFETTLAKAQAEHGIFSVENALAIEQSCRIELIDFQKLINEIPLGGNAAIPLVKQLTRLVKNNHVEASKYVHLGATSQDVIDTATVLQIKQYAQWLLERLAKLNQYLTQLAQQHHATPMIGRTLLQQARPITFGHKVSGWLQSIQRSQERIQASKKRVLVLQLAGAVGNGNDYIPSQVNETMAQMLDIEAATSWQNQRDNLAEWSSILGILVGSLAKIAKDVSLLMQTEVAEVFEGTGEGKGGSSTMPHKRNPVTCAAIIANATRVPHLVATMLSAMPHEHERSVGLWHAEWEVLTELMSLTAGAVERTIELVAALELNEKKMLANLDITKGLIYAENISLALAQHIGKSQAHELVEKACKLAVLQEKHLKEVLQEMNLPLPNLNDLFR